MMKMMRKNKAAEPDGVVIEMIEALEELWCREAGRDHQQDLQQWEIPRGFE